MAIWDFFVKVNTVDLSTYGWQPIEFPGNWDAAAVTYDRVNVPGRDGTVATVLTPTRDSLEMTFRGLVTGTSESDFESKIEGLRLALSQPVLNVIVGNQDARQRTGVRQGAIKVQPMQGGAIDEAIVEFTVFFWSPYAYATTPTTVSGSSGSDLACATGTAHSWPVITVTSPSFPLVFTSKNYAGTTVGTLTIGAGSGTVVVDMGAQTVTIAGVLTPAAVTAGDFFAIEPPTPTDYAASHFPTIRVSSGSPSIVYSKAY